MSTLVRLMRFVLPYWWASASSMTLVFLLTLSRLGPAWFTKTIIDTALPHHNVHLVLGLSLLLLVVALATNILTAVEGYIEQWLGQRVVFDLRNDLYSHLQSQSMSFFDANQTGQLMSRVTNDVATVQNFLGQGFARLINTFVTMALALVLMMAIDVRLSAIALAVFPLIVFYQTRMNSLSSIWRSLQQRMADVNAVIQENVAGIKLIKALGREAQEIAHFNEVNWDMRQQRLKATKMMGFIMPGQEFTGAVSQMLILVFGASFVIQHQMTLGSLVAFQAYAFQFWTPVRFIGFLNQMAQQANAAGARVFKILDTAIDVVEPTNAVSLPSLQGTVTFENISFAYGNSPPLLQDIDFTAAEGTTVALVGPSGSGKTTLVNLLPRFYDPTTGRVLVDGIDIRRVKLHTLRSQVGMVMQETFLFNMTIRENIMYGRAEATMDDVVAAARSANAHDFIMEFPQAYETMVGEKGARLSGGQRQRLAIARAILVDPRILILDEATSAVDTRTDYLITQALQKLMLNRTTIVIAHRLATIQRAHVILVMDGGRIVARGSHQELLESSESYRHLYELQFLVNRHDPTDAVAAIPDVVPEPVFLQRGHNGSLAGATSNGNGHAPPAANGAAAPNGDASNGHNGSLAGDASNGHNGSLAGATSNGNGYVASAANGAAAPNGNAAVRDGHVPLLVGAGPLDDTKTQHGHDSPADTGALPAHRSPPDAPTTREGNR